MTENRTNEEHNKNNGIPFSSFVASPSDHKSHDVEDESLRWRSPVSSSSLSSFSSHSNVEILIIRSKRERERGGWGGGGSERERERERENHQKDAHKTLSLFPSWWHVSSFTSSLSSSAVEQIQWPSIVFFFCVCVCVCCFQHFHMPHLAELALVTVS